jgi:NAD(P)-dependent dehydrogenase (short-subunit alcohol dehydrogenase family)
MSTPKQVVLITGSNSGFGRLMAETLARNGFQVFASMRDLGGKNAGAADQMRGLAASESLALEVCEMDVTNDASANKCVSDVIAKAGRLDVLINNAGFAYMGLTETFTMQQMSSIFDTNVFGVQRTIRAALPQMLKQKSGLFIQVSSGAGRIILPGMTLYCASKFAMEALTEGYRYELASSGIDSVSLEPGAYKTEIFGKIGKGNDPTRADAYSASAKQAPERIEAALNATTADPQEIADAALEIIRTPFGMRQLRYRSGVNGLGVQEINALTDQIQAQIFNAFGIAELTRQQAASSSAVA